MPPSPPAVVGVHELLPTPDAAVVSVPDPADRERLRALDGTPRAEGWVPPRVRLLGEDGGRAYAEVDLPHLAGDVLVLRPRAVDALGPLLTAYGELLPLDGPDPLTLFHCTTVVEALDVEASELQRFTSGGIMRVRRYAFTPAVIVDLALFRDPRLDGTLFAGEEFVDALHAAGLTGLDPRPVRTWEHS